MTCLQHSIRMCNFILHQKETFSSLLSECERDLRIIYMFLLENGAYTILFFTLSTCSITRLKLMLLI